ncbi:MAG: ATP-dependent helicase HrpB [Acidimicrobiales bacterium]
MAPLKRQHTDLPIEAFVDEIVDAVATDGALVLTAEPGAGKSSVVPLLVAEAISGSHGRVVVLEPRRLAARATAARLAGLLGDDHIGGSVGLTIRGERRVSPDSVVEVVTEAVLTGRIQRDPELADVGAIVFDEFHERNLHSDLALAMAIEAKATIRPDLAIIVMSATLDVGPVASLIDTERVVEVPGRTFPVSTAYLPRPQPRQWATAVAGATARALTESSGDVLVFVPGRREIRQVIERLAASGIGGTGQGSSLVGSRPIEVVGLHGGSDGDAQQRALATKTGSGGRRVIVATAVAETSVTIPGIETVVDGGQLRRARFDPDTGLGRLETLHVTKFSADQRRGRAGRLGPGHCIRLWSEEDHRLLDDAVPPEIVDGDPLPIAYELARWGDPDGRSLPLLDHPGAKRLVAGRQVLAELDLVDLDGALTERGRRAGSLGVHPRIGALLLTAERLDLSDVGVIVAAVLDDDRFPRNADLGAECDQRWSELADRAKRLRRRVTKSRNSTSRNSTSRTSTSRTSGATGPTKGRAQLQELGRLLAAAWPDRVARRRAVDGDRYLLATGREVALPRNDPLSGSEFIVVAEADGAAQRALVRRAVDVDRAVVHDALGDRIGWHDSVTWDSRTDRVQAERQQRLGAIVFHREPLQKPSSEDVAAAIGDGLRRVGLDLLRWTDRAIELRQRLAWLHDIAPSEWPAVDDESLLASLDDWLDLSACRSGRDVANLGVAKGLLTLLDWRQRAELDDVAPTELVVAANDRRRKIDYSSGRPVWPVRIQDLFGLDRHPTVGPLTARTPVTIELLSPAGRPAQVTTDLPGFWRGSYADVRRDLRGRYPKHAWPEEPWLR